LVELIDYLGLLLSEGLIASLRRARLIWKEGDMAAPFVDEIFTFDQPDGTKITVRGTGNQFAARFETMDGRPVARDLTSGFFHHVDPNSADGLLKTLGIRAGAIPQAVLEQGVAPPAPRDLPFAIGFGDRSPTRWQQRRHEWRESMRFIAESGIPAAPPQRATIGAFVGLTLLIDFPDVPATIDRTEVQRFCNDSGYSGFGNAGSVRDYFLDVSDGKLDYRNVVLPYYRAKHERAYYTNETIEQPRRAVELMLEAIDAALQAGFDFSDVTADSQGYAYAMNAFYAGPRVNNWAKGLWPHSHHLYEPKKLSPGIIAYDYQITNIGSELTLGTFCHENGHMICDFPDLYDYGYQSSGVGVFCLMCSGGTAPNMKNPTRIGAYLARAAGWTSREVSLAPGMDVTLDANTNDFAIVSRSPTEYYLVENRLNQGRDAGLPTGGIAVWHVDELGNNSNEQMTPTSHYECALMQADNRNDLEHNRNQGDAGDLYRKGGRESWGATAAPNATWWDGTPLDVTIDSIGPVGSPTSFRVT
jgi:M6 family metalloprotease-like protein